MVEIEEGYNEKKKIDHPNKVDLVGKKFGRLTVIKDTGERPSRNVVYECQCDCGNTKKVYGSNLKSGKSKSCGCLKGAAKDLVGQTFGKLKVIKELAERKNTHKVWLCECSCGRKHKATTNCLNRGKVRTCGCSITPDISGKRFGRLVVTGETREVVNGSRTWRCKCDCGEEVVTTRTALNIKQKSSCGCLARELRENFGALANKYRHLHSGENHYNFNPNLTDEDRVKMRYEIQGYDRRTWRKSVFIRDNYTCQVCNKRGEKINAHHLNGYHWHEKGRYDVENGVTLCNECHLEFHGMYGYGENTEKQFIEYKKTKK